MEKTNREVHEDAAGMGLCPEFFELNGIDPDAIAEVADTPMSGESEMPNQSLSSLQHEFSQNAALLIQKAASLGYEVSLGEAWRSPEQAAWNAAHGTGIANSVHCDKCAIDINLFKDGVYITDSTGHSELGTWWKGLGPEYRWGGDFTKRDYNHYSVTPDGVRA